MPLPTSTPWPESLESRTIWDRLPSWLISIGFHAVCVLLVAMNLKSCQYSPLLDASPNSDDGFVEVGIHVPDPQQKPPTEPEQPSTASTQETRVESPTDPLSDVPPVEDLPPVDLPLPMANLPVLGLGSGAPRSLAPQDVKDLVRPNGASQPTSQTGDGVAKASFMGVKAQGTTFVYVIDCSGSMIGAPMGFAKNELLASLESLERTQRFSIIFYNDTYQDKIYKVRGDARSLYWANTINKNFAKRFIARINPDSGTFHKEPLLAAVRMKPEVIFFLTDAKQPALSAGELDEIAKANDGHARIFCIEFGKGGELEDYDNFLKKLARQNNGQYRYRNISALGQ
ncbi:MAG: hypothetical protein O3A00_20505 [Planctomycetota bacterium]|nr:hypothetical protein [Planctomycetota bacterium]